MESKLVELAALKAAFNHFTREHWTPLQAVVISLHDSLCWTCRGNGEPLPDQVQSASAPPSLSITIPIPPPLSPISSNDSSYIPNSSSNSSTNPFLIERQMFQMAQGLEGFVWTDKERAVMQAFFSHYKGEEGSNVAIWEAGEGDRLAGGPECFQSHWTQGRERWSMM